MAAPGGQRSSPLVRALELTWEAIRARHRELPAVVVVLASGSIGIAPGTLNLGHYAAMRWSHGEDRLAEVFVGGEGLRRGPVDVLGTLLHEAAHAPADVRGIKDTSRQGRYHNRRYAGVAREVLLDVAEIGDIGWSDTRPTREAHAVYAEVLDDLGAALTLWRRAEGEAFVGAGGDDPDHGPTGGGVDPGAGGRGRPNSNNPLACACSCPRRIRVAPSVLAQGPIRCLVCSADFEPVDRSGALQAS
ncbi:MAG: hypothetical protein QOF58_6655 [Pseudonocardiales bacterium]|nr:hypothetical protein [Actinomycetota bacterium]MDT7788236.1 hypothetical protein [Pseudonocardiales bacterium]